MIATAFILGAGLGTRLRPLTQNLPKPLLPLGGRPLITYAMDHCLSIGVERFIVNTHHCAGAYDGAFPDKIYRDAPILFRHEPVLLDTAGGLKNIEDLLGEDDGTILVYNGDILSDIPLAPLLAAHAAGGREVTLSLRSCGPLRNVCLDAGGEICDFRDLLGNPGVRRCLFTGIYVVEKRFLARLAPGRIESVVPVFVEMIRQAPGSVASVVIDQGIWEDVGDVTAYSRIAAAVPVLRYHRLEDAGEGRVEAVSQGLRRGGVAEEAGDAEGAEQAERRDAAGNLLPGPGCSCVPAGPSGSPPEQEGDAERRELAAFVRETLGLVSGESVDLTPVGKGGSDRDYFRVTSAGRATAILMRYGRMYEENDGYAAVADFLRTIGVSIPAIHGHDPRRRLILMEDLGDCDLYALRNAPWEVRRGLYEKSLALAAKMHAHPPDRLPAGLCLMPGFDEALYGWERHYFLGECVQNVFGIELDTEKTRALETELAALAQRLLETQRSLVHRDFQSQNVMIRAGEPVFIDFQGLRPGSFFYDLGSLLWDPYVSFPEGGREGLLRFYHEASAASYPWDAFRELFLLAAAQRLMQALGAYGFLGLKRGKRHFLAHIGPALVNLAAVTADLPALANLNALARRCREAAGKGFAPAAVDESRAEKKDGP